MSEENRVQDGQRQCVRGAWVKISEEYKDWDVFRKFVGRVGRLTTRHLSGMWYAEFTGEEEYSFLCGPLLFQLEYSTAEEAEQARLAYEEDLKMRALENAEKEKMSRAWAEMHEKKDAEVAENTRRLFSILQTIQNELTESRSDTQMALKMFQDLTFAASRLEQDLHKTQGSLRQRDGELKQAKMEMERYKRLEGEAKEKLTTAKRKIEERDEELSNMNRNLIEIKGVLKETEVREAGCLDEIEELKKTIEGLEGDVADWSEKYNQTEEELQGVKLKLDQEENVRVEAEGLSAERLEEIERLRGEYEELVKSSSETSEALEAQLAAMAEAKEVAELAVAEMRRPETDSESDGDSGSMSGSGDELGSMPGSRRRGGSKKGSTTSSRRSSDTKSSSRRQVKELTIKCADLEREILRLKNEAKQFSAGAKALEQLPELKSQISSLETRLEMLEGERRRQVSAVQEANKQIAELKQALHDGKRHADELGQTIKRLEGEVVVLDGRIAELEGEVERRDGMIAGLESQLREARDEDGVLRSRIEGLEGELAGARGGWEASKEEVAKLIRAKEELMEEGSGMRGERDALAGELSRAKLMIERLEGDVRKKDKHRVEIDKQVAALEKGTTEQRIEIKGLQDEIKDKIKEMKTAAQHAHHEKMDLQKEAQDLTNRVSVYEFDAFVRQGVREQRLETVVPAKMERTFFVLWRYNVALHKAFDIAQAKREMTRKVNRAEIESVSLRKRLSASHRLISELQRNNAAHTSAANALSGTLNSWTSAQLSRSVQGTTRSHGWADAEEQGSVNMSALTPVPSIAGDAPTHGWGGAVEGVEASIQTDLSIVGRREGWGGGGLKEKLLKTVLEGGRESGEEEEERGGGEEEEERGSGEEEEERGGGEEEEEERGGGEEEEERGGGEEEDGDVALSGLEVAKLEIYRLEKLVSSLEEQSALNGKMAADASMGAEGLTQRNSRLQKEAQVSADLAAELTKSLKETKGKLSELEKQAHSLLGCLRLGEAAVGGVRDGRVLKEAKAALEVLSIRVLEKERAMSSALAQNKAGALVTSHVSPIVIRKNELNNEVENGKGKGGSGSGGGATSRGRKTARGNASMAPSATLEQVEDDLEGSVKLLQSQVAVLTDKLESGSAKRKARQMGFLSRADIPVPSRDGLPELIGAGYSVKGADAGRRRPASAMGRMNQ